MVSQGNLAHSGLYDICVSVILYSHARPPDRARGLNARVINMMVNQSLIVCPEHRALVVTG